MGIAHIEFIKLSSGKNQSGNIQSWSGNSGKGGILSVSLSEWQTDAASPGFGGFRVRKRSSATPSCGDKITPKQPFLREYGWYNRRNSVI